MAINYRDVAEWFERYDRLDDDVVYGILERKDGWVVLKKEYEHPKTKVSEIVQVDSRKAAIGFIKLLLEK